jgi:hypothetical protein
MRRCDGIFSVNWVDALLTQQQDAVIKKHDRFSRRACKLFFTAGQSSAVSRLTTLARRRREKIKKFFGAPKISTEAVENFWIT